MATALDTLCGQAYGAKKYKLLGLYLQRSLIILNLSAVPFAFIFIYVGDILQWLKQDTEIAVGAGQYIRCLIPSLFSLATSQSYVRFILAQSLVLPILVCGFTTFVVHIPLCWFLVYRSSLGYLGAGIAASITSWINALLLASYASFSKDCEATRTHWSWEAFHDLKSFVSLAIPSTAMTWYYTILCRKNIVFFSSFIFCVEHRVSF